jgi:hypothetical protein
MKAQDFLQAGLGHMQDRAATYDKPTGERSMAATVGAFKCVSGVEMTEEQGWLFMGLLKMVRSQQGEFKADNYEDEAAYAALRGECAFAARSGDTASPVAHGGVTNPEGWIGWPGGDCPLKDSGIEYDLKFGDGEILVDDKPESYAWDIETAGCHKDTVIAYRIHKAGE